MSVGPNSATRGSLIMTLFVIGTVAVALASCSAGTPSGSAPSTPKAPSSSTVSSTPASPADQAEQAALAAYRGMWQDFSAAGQTSDWQSPSLGQFATGSALSVLSRGLYTDHANGWVTKGSPILHPTVQSAEPLGSPTTVVISDCGDSTKYLKYYVSSGQPVNDGPGGRQLIKATLQKQSDGSWKVSDFGIQGVGSC